MSNELHDVSLKIGALKRELDFDAIQIHERQQILDHMVTSLEHIVKSLEHSN